MDLARQLAANPDDPASLRIVSAMNHAMRPAAQAAAQVVEALAEQLSAPSERTETAVAAAVRHWESVCKSPMDQEVMIGLKDEAVALAQQLGARLELVAVFDDEDRRVPIHLGRDDAA